MRLVTTPGDVGHEAREPWPAARSRWLATDR